MNIFLPYEDNIVKSIQALDDVRLNKQISECKTIYKAITQHQQDGSILGYFYHPVTQFYYNNPEFVAWYGLQCCFEYMHRQDKVHECHHTFSSVFAVEKYHQNTITKINPPSYVPYYMEGLKSDPKHIRTTEKVGELFRNKLCKKWKEDTNKNRKPKWTNRKVPEFYRGV